MKSEQLSLILREFIKAIPQTPKNEREEFLEEVRKKVGFYQPKIEDKCEIEFGSVGVVDYEKFPKHYFIHHMVRELFDKKNLCPTKEDYEVLSSAFSWIKPIVTFPLSVKMFFSGIQMKYYANCLYVPFTYSTRFGGIEYRKTEIDPMVVHELSHCLWEHLGGNQLGVNPKIDPKWSEGFATYCADDYFSEFYPANTKRQKNLPRVYTEGKRKIIRCLEQGVELFEIPTRWQEFERELKGNDERDLELEVRR